MKKIFFISILSLITISCFAQETAEDNSGGDDGGFKKGNLFTGGGLDLGFSTYNTVLGAEPEFGYSLARWLDAGVVFNFVYSSERETAYDYYGNLYLTGYKIRQTDFGPGAFVRVYPVDFIFLQAQFEENYIKYKEINPAGSVDGTFNPSASSLLLGAGYCTGRQGGSGQPFFYLSIMADVLANKYSPYVELDGGGNPIIIPIVRGGIQVPLFQGKRDRYVGHHRDNY